MSPKKTAHENPLIPNARLKQMYRAILRAHLLGQSLPPAQRALTSAREAALVTTSIDLTPRDLVLDAFSAPVLDFLRGTSLHRALARTTNARVPRPSSARVGLKTPGAPSKLRLGGFAGLSKFADAGSPSLLVSPSDAAARIQSVLGAAAALKSPALLTKKDAKQSANAHDSAVVLCIAISGEVPVDTWKSALTHAAQHDLPIIFLVLPPISARKSSPRAVKSAPQNEPALRAIAHRAGVPAIPVDAADPVALYRVAQESIGHARIGGGPALIQCVAFPAPASGKPRSSRPSHVNPALAHIEDYILTRNIASRAWMDREASSFAARIQSLKSASK